MPTLDPQVAHLVETLHLVPHPEGGYFRETWRSALAIGNLPHGEPRAAGTAIYFLLPAGTFSALHRVASDEAWHFYDGDPVELHVLEGDGDRHVHRAMVLGRDLAQGERPQYVVPAGAWQAAVPIAEGAGVAGVARGWSLCGCTVAPGFDFADFEMPNRDELLRMLPDFADLVKRLSRG